MADARELGSYATVIREDSRTVPVVRALEALPMAVKIAAQMIAVDKDIKFSGTEDDSGQQLKNLMRALCNVMRPMHQGMTALLTMPVKGCKVKMEEDSVGHYKELNVLVYGVLCILLTDSARKIADRPEISDDMDGCRLLMLLHGRYAKSSFTEMRDNQAEMRRHDKVLTGDIDPHDTIAEVERLGHEIAELGGHEWSDELAMAELSQTLTHYYVGVRRDVSAGRITSLSVMQQEIIQDYKEFGAVEKKKEGQNKSSPGGYRYAAAAVGNQQSMSEQMVMMQGQISNLVAAAAAQQQTTFVPPQGGGGRGGGGQGGRGGNGGRGGYAGRGGRGPCFACGGPHYVSYCPPENKAKHQEWVRTTFPQHAEAEMETAVTAWVDYEDNPYGTYEWNSDEDIAC